MNKYDILKVIDEGAYGIVLQGRHKDSGSLGQGLTSGDKEVQGDGGGRNDPEKHPAGGADAAAA
jgi:hypothetical protein